MLYRTNGFTPNYDPKDPFVTYFQNHQPGEWRKDPGNRAEFERVYGAMALMVFDSTGWVPENVEAVWVRPPYTALENEGPRLVDPSEVTGPIHQPTEFEKYVVSTLEKIALKLGA